MSGRTAGKCWPFRGILFLTCMVAALGLCAQAWASEADRGANGSKKSGELSCTGAVHYQVGTGAWLAQNQGSVPVVLPVGIQSDKATCRLTFGGTGLFEAKPGSKFTLAQASSNHYLLTLEKGSVIYSLGRGVELQIKTPLPGVGVKFIGSRPATATVSTASGTYVGGLSTEAANSLHVVNVSGATAVDQDGKTMREVAIGHDIWMSLDTRPAAAPLESGKVQKNGLLVFTDRSTGRDAGVGAAANQNTGNNGPAANTNSHTNESPIIMKPEPRPIDLSPHTP